ncbi:MAG: valine--tRNA ligase [Deltaproteobacteria bacterium]|nr:valine--tRNA ligase [Deltaproteobacteria bacterium]
MPTGALDLPKAYEHAEVEARWYPIWLANKYFAAQDESDKPPYCIVIPPPNVTGSLHIGHALTVTIEDILTRWKRMQGFNTLWMPGTDHAGIATQMVVERELAKEGVSRFDLGRERFVAKVWEWKATYHARITKQLQVMGVSVDWDRERFTMDEGLSRAVRVVFKRLYDDGLIYRANRLVNWSPGIHTVLSDLEVEHKQVQGSLWHIAYPVTGRDERLVVATTRPETMLGDTAVAVHPDDPRYQHLIGQTVDLPLTGRKIPIIADAVLVDMAFGSGAVKVTPGHDFNDFETGLRHGLPMISILDADARLNENAPEAYRGLDRFEGRRRVVKDLDDAGLLVKTEPHLLNLGHCQRTGVVVEPMLSTQWYVRAKPLADKALDAVQSGRTRFTSIEWERTFYHWMTNIKDWCISRQLWWGHQVPAWFCPDGHITVAAETPGACATCGATALRQDDDVLDTWFSSGLWPFSTLGWPDDTKALRTFYPNAVMETGFDILFFWVARMMMLGIYCMGDVPFRVVYMHPMVRDDQGQKMSKTRNNVIDPLDVTDKHGADALRFTLAALTTQGHDLAFSVDRLAGYRAFANKIWNATRFVFMNLEADKVYATPVGDAGWAQATTADRWIMGALQATIADVTARLDDYDFAGAAHAVYQFFWSKLCDWYIELSKTTLRAGGAPADLSRRVLVHCLDQGLRLLHPFMPYISEELWTRLPLAERDAPSLVIARWPVARPELVDEDAERAATTLMALIGAVRGVRAGLQIPPRTELAVVVSAPDQATAALAERAGGDLGLLANVGTLTVGVGAERPAKSAVAVADTCTVYVPLEGIIDIAQEIARLDKAMAKIDKDIQKLADKLGNERFVAQAPADVVAEQRARLSEAQATRATYAETIARLRG